MKIKPSAVWVYTPYLKPPDRSTVMNLYRNSGLIGTFEGFAVLKKMDVNVFFITGSSQEISTYEEIVKFARAARVYKDLKTTKLAILPYRNDLMIACYVDEFRLYSQIGPKVDYISVLQLKKAAESISDSTVQAYVDSVKTSFRIDNRITSKNLFISARASLGMEKILFERGIDGLALSDLNPELLEVIGLRPVLYPYDLAHSAIVIGNEGDFGCTTAMVMLHRLTDKPVMFTEFFSINVQDNTIVAGHAGPANYLLAGNDSEITITPDYELMNSPTNISGVWMEFIGKPGRVTLANFICSIDNFQLTITGGESLGGDLRLDGYPHCYIKIDPDMKDFLNMNAMNGTSHHWAVVHGDVRGELSYLAEMMNVMKIIV
jgi:L-arabinose isomerase